MHLFAFMYSTGCSLNIVVFFSKILKYSGLFPFSLGVGVCTHTRQVEHQRCSRTDRVQKNHKILRKKHNFSWTPCTIFRWCLLSFLFKRHPLFSLQALSDFSNIAKFSRSILMALFMWPLLRNWIYSPL